jgi:hypothetical protein
MSQNKPAKGNDKIRTIVAKDPAQQPGKLKMLGGSTSDEWNDVLANQTIQTLWLSRSDDETIDRQLAAATAVLIGISPQDELEGMLAGQLIAAHNAAMECYRRAMISEQTLEGRRENLNQANKLSRTYTSLLEALNRHRGKGQQKVTVEHVHVHKGGQAIVGHIEHKAEGGGEKKERSTPCKANYPCISVHDVAQRPGRAALADHQRCRMVAAECTAENHQELRRVTKMR